MIIPHLTHPAARKLASSCLLAALLLLLSAAAVLAQSPDAKPAGSNPIMFLPNDVSPVAPKRPAELTGKNPILFLPLLNSSGDNAALDIAAAGMSAPAPIKLVVDTDPGVDDAVALNWLLTQRSQPLQMLGVVTVAGNTTVENATNNALLILHKLGRQDVPVVMGASSPHGGQLTKTSYFIHGPDGLWFLGWQNPQDLSKVANNAGRFYCDTLSANLGAYILALGPLTNLAQAVQKCPQTMATAGKLLILGGAKYGGNQTPVAEFNFWQDPKCCRDCARQWIAHHLGAAGRVCATYRNAAGLASTFRTGHAGHPVLGARYPAIYFHPTRQHRPGRNPRCGGSGKLRSNRSKARSNRRWSGHHRKERRREPRQWWG